MAFPVGDGKVFNTARVWSARPDVAHDILVPGGRIDNSLVEDYVHSLAKRFRIRELVYDPRYFEETATRLGRAGIPVAPMYPGTKIYGEATDRFYLDCHERKVLHLAGDEGSVLTQHVEAAVAIKTESGWRISKLRATRPIDALVAMVMAHSRAVRRYESVYERRGLVTVGPEELIRRRGVLDDEDWD